MSEHEARARMLGKQVMDLVYVLDHGKETMFIGFGEFAIRLEPVEVGSTGRLHLSHRIIPVDEVPTA